MDKPEYVDVLGDSLYTQIGTRVIQILQSCDMIKLVLIKPTYKERLYILEVAYKGLLDKREKQPIINMPTKLPMIPVPKPYSCFGWLSSKWWEVYRWIVCK